MIEIKITQDQARHLENFVEDHVMFCRESLDDFQEDMPENWEPYGPYCGCMTCDSREHLMATFDWLRQNDILDLYIGEN